MLPSKFTAEATDKNNGCDIEEGLGLMFLAVAVWWT